MFAIRLLGIFQRMNIQPQATEKSRVYHNELDEIVRQREEQRKNDTLQQRQRSVEVIYGFECMLTLLLNSGGPALLYPALFIY